eukprot:TRINITY_DN74641_c0_g1_i1.p1 TRINITY_DN74641_c0_g1~~TRINITY_DN74641_c0_g1_i1.p1  ORF type:complete len:355 (+),score=16.97 TRINITY_DN74641_c0_g1_i1:63-1127(+)
MEGCLFSLLIGIRLFLGSRRSANERHQLRRDALYEDEVQHIHTIRPVSLPQNFNPIPDDLLPLLVSLLPLLGLSRCLQTCPRWRFMLNEARLWQYFCESLYPSIRWPCADLFRESLRQLVTGSALLNSLRSCPDERCGCGQTLARVVLGPDGGISCDVCGANELPAGTTMWGCRRCNFDMCSKCRQKQCHRARKNGCCRLGHGLEQHIVAVEGFHCNDCGKRKMPIGATMWGCRTCNFDRCWNCHLAPSASPFVLAKNARNCCDEEGWTALHHACRLGFWEIAERLIASKADVDVVDRNYGYTPLMVGATHGHREVCSLLLARHATKQHKNKYGRSALDYALRWGNADLTQLLS